MRQVSENRLRTGACMLSSLALLILLCSSCEKPTARLIEIHTVERDDDAQVLSVSGQGFPGSHRGEARLEGTLYRPGEGPELVVLTLECHALSDEILRIDLAQRDEPDLQGLLEGKLEIRFNSKGGTSDVIGTIAEVRLRLLPKKERDPAALLALARRARAFHRSLGALEVEATPKGLVLSDLAADSALARLGVHEGDRLERLDGAPLERVVDLLPRDEHSGHFLDLVKRGGGQKERVFLGRLEPRAPLHTDLSMLGFLAAAIASLFIPPSPGRTEAASRRWLPFAAPCLTFLTFLIASRVGAELDLRLLCGLPMAALTIALGIEFARRRLTGSRALTHVVQLSAVGLSLASLPILSGSLTTSWFGTAHTALPDAWCLLSAPPAWLCLLVIASARARTQSARASLLLGWAHFSVLTAVVALCAGAGTVPHGASTMMASAPVGLLLLVGKVGILHLLMKTLPARDSSSLLVVLGLLCPLTSWLFMLWPAAGELTFPIGAALLGFGLVHGARAWALSRVHPPRDPLLTPFL